MHKKILAALRCAAKQKHIDRLAKEVRLKKDGLRGVGKLSRRDLFIAGLALYWGEGYKSSNGELGFTNSDPAMILFFIKWLQAIYGVPRDTLVLRVSVNNLHAYRVREIERYWSKVTSLPLSQFTMTSLIKTISKKRYTNESEHFGTLRVKVRSGTDLRRRILGSVAKLQAYTT